jgi:iron complex outermembrane receptor protein
MGELFGTFNDDSIDWNLGVTYSENQYKVQSPDIITSRLNSALAGTGGVNGDQLWDPFDPTGNDASLVEWLKGTESYKRTTDLTVVDAVVAGDVFELGGGNVKYAAGAQWRNEGYKVDRNDLSTTTRDAEGVLQPANLTFLGGGTEVDVDRDSWAVFAELLFPITDTFEVTAAVRYENLDSDTSTDPKVALRWAATEELTFRASASTSFREPSLPQIYAADTSLQGIADTDPDTGELATSTNFIRVTSTGSENLTAEQSDNYNAGVIWAPTENIDIRLDYWKIEYKDVIQLESAQGKVLADRCGPDIIREGDCATGNLVGVTASLFNAASVDTDGLDLEATWNIDAGNWGSFVPRLNVSHFLSYEIPNGTGGTQDVAGYFNYNNFARSLPETKANLSLTWMRGNQSATATAYYVDSYKTTRTVPDDESQDIDDWTTLDLQYGYRMDVGDSSDINLALGVKNATDKNPPRVYDGANLSYDPKQHSPLGRVFYASVTYGF